MRFFFFLALFLGLWCVELSAQSLPDLYSAAPKSLGSSQVLASMPEKTFLENLLFWNGGLYATNHYTGEILKLSDNGLMPFASIKGVVTALASFDDKYMYANGSNANKESVVWRISQAGNVEEFLKLEGVAFPNGMITIGKAGLLVADSYGSKIIKIDIQSKKQYVWLANSLLARSTPDAYFPGVNGIKIHSNFLYFTNTEKKIIGRVSINKGEASGQPELVAENQNWDDFCILSDGTLIGTTHVYNNLIMIKPNDQPVIVAGPEEGMVGSTAVITDKKSEKVLYITTNGGMSYPPASGLEKSKIVKIILQ